MASLVFDPAKGCPLIRNFNCAKADCNFYDAERVECIIWDGLAGHNNYVEVVTATADPADEIIDLGGVFKDITLFVDAACTIKFHSATDSSLDFSVALGRVGTPVVFRGINARYVLISGAGAINITATGNG
jgi:hypothetical protein